MRLHAAVPVLPLLFIALLTAAPAVAQQKKAASSDSVKTVQVKKEVRAGRVYTSNQVTVFVETYRTQSEVFGLFKPDEIVIKNVPSPTQSMNQMTVQIRVKDKQHLMLKYFRNKARLYHQGAFYEHNVLPEIPAAAVMKLQYHSVPGTEPGSGDYLEVIQYGEEYVPRQPLVFSTGPHRLAYYDVNGKIISADDLPSLHLQEGSFTMEELSGKEAVEKYGDPKYAAGIGIIRIKK